MRPNSKIAQRDVNPPFVNLDRSMNPRDNSEILKVCTMSWDAERVDSMILRRNEQRKGGILANK